MPRGASGTVPYERTEGRWYELLHDHPETPYKSSGVLGLDLQFSGGLEFRIFDDVRDEQLAEVLGLLVWCAGEALGRCETVANPRQDPLWNQVMVRCLMEGREAVLLPVEASRFRDVLGCSDSLPLSVVLAYDAIRTETASASASSWDWGAMIRTAIESQLSSSVLLETMGTTTSKPASPVAPSPVGPSVDLSGSVPEVTAPVADLSGATPEVSPVAPVADLSGATPEVTVPVTDLSGAPVTDLSGAPVTDLSGVPVTDLSGATPVSIESAPVVGSKKICCCY